MNTTLAAVVVAISGAAQAGEPWTEIGDAGDFPVGSAQSICGSGATLITGTLNQSTGDHVDAFTVCVTDASMFSASLVPALGGSFDDQFLDDARLYLFDLNGTLVMASDDTPSALVGTYSYESTLWQPATWLASGGATVNNPQPVVDGSSYVLAITSFPSMLLDGDNVSVVDFDADYDALHGKNPNAADGAAWFNIVEDDIVRTYEIALAGVQVEVPGDIDGDGNVNVFDLLDLLAAWGPCEEPWPATPDTCLADFTDGSSGDPDCVVNVFDLLELLSNWG